MLSAQLKCLTPLAELPPSARPSLFLHTPSADSGSSDRLARACQAHALALAEARVGSKWWLPLRRLKGGAGGGGGAPERGDDQSDWEEEDRAWRCNWERVLKEEAARSDGLGGGVDGAQQRRRGMTIEYSLESLG